MATAALEIIKDASQTMKRNFGEAPKLALVLGSGLGKFADELKDSKSISFNEIPGGVPSTVVGHSGKLVCGSIGETRVLISTGRIHGYEGHSPTQIVHLMRAARMWGVEKFILTNASGSTSKKLKPGRITIISDHLNLTGLSPLTGTELFGGERFPDMSNLYDQEWRKKVQKLGPKLKLKLREGVYAGLNGPQFETAAEIKMLAGLGADMVGMSTVWEAIALHQMGAKILGLSCVCNFGTGITKNPLSHQEVLEAGRKAANAFKALLREVIQET